MASAFVRHWDTSSTETKSGKPAKKKAGTGDTAMMHARAIAAARWPGQPTLAASKRIVWMPTKTCGSCGRGLIPRSMSEDIFGVFDLAIIGFGVSGGLIQVTTGAGGVSPRRRKIEEWLDCPDQRLIRHHSTRSALSPAIEVWAWIKSSYMRRWRLDREYPAFEWTELAPVRSPALKNATKIIGGTS